ncbi:molybdenum cofactor biosynthesis protein MoaE [Pontixanthobacter luteolus]|uniref:molybdenum cofactor biosynthesis protein MoaE n=1 Tax=Pontixanthobacter luteolus TaxID=295089 RepID=UPI003F6A0896
MALRDVRLVAEPFDSAELVERAFSEVPDTGGVCTFTGMVRRSGGVEALELTHYEPLTLPGMHDLADAAITRFDLLGLLMVHRIGQMVPGDDIVCVSAAAMHRRDAIDAADFCMDHLKSAAWFWKREKRSDGWHWIEPRPSDHASLARWK